MWILRIPAATGFLPHTSIGFRRVFAMSIPIYSYQAAPIFTSSSHHLSSPTSRYTPGAGLCQLVPATKGDTSELLNSPKDGTSTETVKRVLEMANRALLRRDILHTDFLTPPLLRESMLALEKLADIRAVRHGGYSEAERCRISVEHQDVTSMVDADDAVVALSIIGNFKFQPCSHGDFMGSVLGTGITREKVGDIILQGEKGAQVIVVPELADFIITSLTKVGNVSVSCTRISLDELEYEPPTTKTFKTVEASIRLDALASAGFKISRAKLVDVIRKGDVRVNWNTALKNGATLKTGDVVSVSGMGRLKIGEINVTKKGKYSVELIRYL